MLRPSDDLVRAREAIVAGSASLLRGEAVEALAALVTASHHIGRAVYDGSPLAEYAEVHGLATALQVELGLYLLALCTPARGAA